MASNNLTPREDLIVRSFLTEILYKDTLFTGQVASRGQAIGLCLSLLNYDYINGKYIEAGQSRKVKLGGVIDVACEWEADYEAAYNAENQSEASSGESSEDTPVREALLPEDV